jgi:cytochrome P450
LLGEFDIKRYRLQRKLIGPIYSKRSLLKHEKAIDEVLLLAIARLKALKGTEVDLKEFMHIITVECLAAVVLSWSPGYLKSGTDFGVAHHAYLGWRRKSVFGLFPWAEVLDGYFPSLGRLFARLWGLTFKTPPRYKALFPILGTKVKKRINAALRPSPPKDNRQDLIYELINLHKDKPEFSGEYLKRMVMSNFGAGHETMTSTLISIFAMLGSHPTVQTKAFSEVTTTEPVTSYSTASNLKYTLSTIKESQRLYPTIGMSLSRLVPFSGLHDSGHYFSPGVTVGCNPVSLHRNSEIFGPDAEAFVPERWLDAARVLDMNRYNLVFGGGMRTCPGQNLAELIIWKIVPTLLRYFEIEVEMPREEDVSYYFMAMLTGVRVRFIERGSE